MMQEIRKEINRAPFVAVMMDETMDVSTAEQCSLILRCFLFINKLNTWI